MLLNNYYVAGLFDGEGWFEITRGDGKKWRMKREYGYGCRACIQMRDKIIIDSLAETYGGTVRKYSPRRETHSTTYKWIVTGKKAQDFAKSIEPYLIAKNKQAKVVIDFQDEKNLNGNRPLSDERYTKYGTLYEELKFLNKKGVKHE